MTCPNRRGMRDYDEDLGECGDEGQLCEACEDKDREYWARYFGAAAKYVETQEQLDRDLRDAGRGHLVRA